METRRTVALVAAGAVTLVIVPLVWLLLVAPTGDEVSSGFPDQTLTVSSLAAAACGATALFVASYLTLRRLHGRQVR